MVLRSTLGWHVTPLVGGGVSLLPGYLLVALAGGALKGDFLLVLPLKKEKNWRRRRQAGGLK